MAEASLGAALRAASSEVVSSWGAQSKGWGGVEGGGGRGDFLPIVGFFSLFAMTSETGCRDLRGTGALEGGQSLECLSRATCSVKK